MTDADPAPPLPSQIPSSPSSPPRPIIHPKSVAAAISSLPGNTDAFLQRLQKCISTPAGTDAILLLVCYASKLLSQVLASASIQTLHARARQVVALALSFPPGKEGSMAGANAGVSVLLAPASASGLPAKLMGLSLRLKALSGMLSDVRAFGRLWGLLGMYFWAKKLVLAKRSADYKPPKTMDSLVGHASLASCIAFQAMENVAYLGAKNVLPVSPQRQASLYCWSSRFWALYVGLDLGRLMRELLDRRATRQERRVARAKAASENMDPAAAAEAGRAMEEEEKEWLSQWKRTFLRQCAWAPITVHYSKEKGLMSDAMVGLLGSVPGMLSVGALWKEAGKAV
ncbi:putative peroxin 11c protein [Zalerion maritima]|uniref:Peroxin 11c protein n=1 Tax=Zalerion maritima TaxID=339359 RepID=A0AAD5WPH8_9PEZI|nr:putative peroxin 11c protein [Zalerion maritima]